MWRRKNPFAAVLASYNNPLDYPTRRSSLDGIDGSGDWMILRDESRSYASFIFRISMVSIIYGRIPLAASGSSKRYSFADAATRVGRRRSSILSSACFQPVTRALKPPINASESTFKMYLECFSITVNICFASCCTRQRRAWSMCI